MSYDLLFRQAIEYHQLGNFDKAEQIYRHILETLPHHPDVLNLLGLIAQSKNIHQEAINLFYQAIQSDNKRSQFYFNLGISLRLWNKPYEALEAFQKSVSLDANIKETWLEIGNLYKELHKPEEANKAYNQALNLDNHYTEALINQITLNNPPSKAITELEKLKQSYPNTPQIDFQLGFMYFHQQIYSKALPLIKSIVSDCPQNEEANSLLGQIYLATQDTAKAQEAFIQTLHIAPNNIQALINLANIETSHKNYSQAEKHYLRAIELDNNNFDVHHNYATMLYHQKRTSEALEEYRKAIIINPQSAEACNNLGLILREQQDFTEALGLFFNALSIKPNQEEISLNIAETLTLYHNHTPQSAIEIAQNWVSQYPNNTFAQHTFSALQGINKEDNQQYAQKLFDNFAPSYDNTLLNLKYTLPTQIHELVGELKGNILDLGCGTGLTGEHIKSEHNTLYGVDISSNMLELAKTKNIYHQLYHQDIISYLQNNRTNFDFIIAADVFCYISELEPIFKLCSPTPLCFSIETSEDTKTYQITPSGRYKHSPHYIKQLLNKYGYTQIIEYSLNLRNENHQPVKGMIFIAKP